MAEQELLPQEVVELRNAISCLYLAVPADIADDVRRKAVAVMKLLETRATTSDYRRGVEDALKAVDVCNCGSGPQFRPVDQRYHLASCSKHIATMARALLATEQVQGAPQEKPPLKGCNYPECPRAKDAWMLAYPCGLKKCAHPGEGFEYRCDSEKGLGSWSCPSRCDCECHKPKTALPAPPVPVTADEER